MVWGQPARPAGCWSISGRCQASPTPLLYRSARGPALPPWRPPSRLVLGQAPHGMGRWNTAPGRTEAVAQQLWHGPAVPEASQYVMQHERTQPAGPSVGIGTSSTTACDWSPCMPRASPRRGRPFWQVWLPTLTPIVFFWWRATSIVFCQHQRSRHRLHHGGEEGRNYRS